MSARNNMSWYPDIRRLMTAARRTPGVAAPSAAAPEAEAWMVFGMRVLLSVSALLTLYIGPGGVVASSAAAWGVDPFTAVFASMATLLVCGAAAFVLLPGPVKPE